MNRDDKRMMRRVIQKYDNSLRNAHGGFEKEIGKLQYREETKLASLPSSFETSRVADNLTESSEMLGRILKAEEKIMNLLDDILYESGVSSTFKDAPCRTEITQEKKDASFHALLPSSLLKRLKDESLRTGLSMNEIVCQALREQLKH